MLFLKFGLCTIECDETKTFTFNKALYCFLKKTFLIKEQQKYSKVNRERSVQWTITQYLHP